MSDFDPWAFVFCIAYGKTFDVILARGSTISDQKAVAAAQKRIVAETKWAIIAYLQTMRPDKPRADTEAWVARLLERYVPVAQQAALVDAANPLQRVFHAAVLKLEPWAAIWEPWAHREPYAPRDVAMAACALLDEREPTVELDGAIVPISTVFERMENFHQALPLFHHDYAATWVINFDCVATYATAAEGIGYRCSSIFERARDLKLFGHPLPALDDYRNGRIVLPPPDARE